MNPVSLLARVSSCIGRPEYFFRPTQIARRLGLRMSKSDQDTIDIILPWGLPIRCRFGDVIGSSIARTGIYDLSVTELIWRLLDPGESAIDAGANIGYMTSIMAARVGRNGRVFSFEPHPEIFPELSHNVSLWKDNSRIGPIETRRVALSDRAGTAMLSVPPEFASNRGTCSLEKASDNEQGHLVDTKCLDNEIPSGTKTGLMKVDVEGHELPLLKGGGSLFRDHRIRDVVFEAHDGPSSPVVKFLQSHGYALFRLTRRFLGPAIEAVGNANRSKESPCLGYDAPSYLATLDAGRAASRLRSRGWQALRSRRP